MKSTAFSLVIPFTKVSSHHELFHNEFELEFIPLPVLDNPMIFDSHVTAEHLMAAGVSNCPVCVYFMEVDSLTLRTIHPNQVIATLVDDSSTRSLVRDCVDMIKRYYRTNQIINRFPCIRLDTFPSFRKWFLSTYSNEMSLNQLMFSPSIIHSKANTASRACNRPSYFTSSCASTRFSFSTHPSSPIISGQKNQDIFKNMLQTCLYYVPRTPYHVVQDFIDSMSRAVEPFQSSSVSSSSSSSSSVSSSSSSSSSASSSSSSSSFRPLKRPLVNSTDEFFQATLAECMFYLPTIPVERFESFLATLGSVVHSFHKRQKKME